MLDSYNIRKLCTEDPVLSLGSFHSNFMLSSKTTKYIFSSRGNSILVGSLGEQLNSLASFSFFLAGYDMQSLDCSREGSFRDGMKSLFRQAGMEGKPIGVVIKVSSDLMVLQSILLLTSHDTNFLLARLLFGS